MSLFGLFAISFRPSAMRNARDTEIAAGIRDARMFAIQMSSRWFGTSDRPTLSIFRSGGPGGAVYNHAKISAPSRSMANALWPPPGNTTIATPVFVPVGE